MGEKHSIYSSAATAIGPLFPDVRHEVCHRGGRPGDNKQETLWELEGLVSRHPYTALVILPGLSILCSSLESDKLDRVHYCWTHIYTLQWLSSRPFDLWSEVLEKELSV